MLQANLQQSARKLGRRWAFQQNKRPKACLQVGCRRISPEQNQCSAMARSKPRFKTYKEFVE